MKKISLKWQLLSKISKDKYMKNINNACMVNISQECIKRIGTITTHKIHYYKIKKIDFYSEDI